MRVAPAGAAPAQAHRVPTPSRVLVIMSNEPPTPAGPPDDVWERIARHAAGEDGPEERAATRAELDAHPERERLLAALDESVILAAEPLLSQDHVEAALQKVMARRDEPVRVPHVAAPPVRDADPQVIPMRRPRSRPLWFALPAAAVILMALGATFLWRQLRQGGADDPRVIYATGIGETQRIQLEDGSTVQLAPLTRLAVAGDYGRARRELRLEGEAFITVTHDARRPFVVRTARAEVEDLGTAFTLRADSAETDVTVTQGSVALRPEGGAQTVLRAGDHGRVGAGGHVTAGAAGTTTAEETGWTQGRLAFRDTPLAELAGDFHRWYGLTLVIPDPSLAQRPVTATFPTASADEALQVLAATAGVRIDRRGDTVTLLPAR
jgi:transmembrane sensor